MGFGSVSSTLICHEVVDLECEDLLVITDEGDWIIFDEGQCYCEVYCEGIGCLVPSMVTDNLTLYSPFSVGWSVVVSRWSLIRFKMSLRSVSLQLWIFP